MVLTIHFSLASLVFQKIPLIFRHPNIIEILKLSSLTSICTKMSNITTIFIEREDFGIITFIFSAVPSLKQFQKILIQFDNVLFDVLC